MSTAGINTYSFAVNHQEAALAIATAGSTNTIILEGEPGISKSAVLTTMKHMLGDAYDYIYVDVPLKDIPQIALSMPDHATQTVKDYIHSLWLGSDPTKPKVVMVDEVFKGNEYVRLMLNRLLYEQYLGDYKLPEGSIVFGSTNAATDGLGDRSNGHTNNRITTLQFRKPTQEEWMHWAVNNGVNDLLLTWVDKNPAVFQSYRDTEFDARLHQDGEGVFHYIYHPQHNNKAYVSPRSLEKASHILHQAETLGTALATKMLIGTVGAKAALDMDALFAVGADLPHPKDIVAAPDSARIPKNGAAQMMMVFKSMSLIKPETMDAYATYFMRFPMEQKSTWVKTLNGIDSLKVFALKNQQVREFAIANAWVL